MKLTKEQKAELIDKLSHPYGRVALMCDGYRIDLVVQAARGLHYRIVTYINGQWEGKWILGMDSFPEQKFLNRKERPMAKPSEKAKAEKIFGKRSVAKDPWYSKTLVTFDISWASGKSAINHLCKVCESIEIIADEGGV